jgi:hypothetical protein
MRIDIVRAIFTVAPRDGTWTVEFEGENFGHSADREVAKAFAHKRARELMATGRPCEVRVYGEHGYFGAR